MVGRDSLQQSIDKVGHLDAYSAHYNLQTQPAALDGCKVLLQYMKKRESIMERDGVPAP